MYIRFKRIWLLIFCFVILIVAIFLFQGINAARLPTVGGDADVWGSIFIEFLNITLDQNGTIRNNTINTRQINDSAVTSNKINASSINSTHIIDGTINSDDLATSAVNSTHIVDGTIDSSDIRANAINGSHISNSSNIIVNNINATTFSLGLESVTGECSGLGCVIQVNCTAGKKIIYGMGGGNILTCDTVPSACDTYCTIGSTNCSVTGGVTGASVYLICGKIA